MSYNKFISEYKSIKAPDELYERILNADTVREKKNNVVLFRRIAASAAAFAVIAVTGFVLLTGDSAPEIYVGNEQLTGEITLSEAQNNGIMLARAGDAVECDLNFSVKREALVSVSDGFLQDADGKTILESGENKSFSGEFTAKWTVPFADAEKEYTLILKDKKNEYSVKLYFDSIDNEWVVNLTE